MSRTVDEPTGVYMDEVAEAALRRGEMLLEVGRPKEAEAQLRIALTADPGNGTLLALLARALLEQERYEPARDTGRDALAADPENVLALSVLGAALAGLKRYSDALDTVRRGLALAPEIAGLHRQEGAVLLAMDRPADALDSVQRARRLDPESSATAALHAGVLFELHRYREADDAVAEALRLNPENPEAHRLRGLLALRRGGGRSAVASHRTALRLDPTDVASREGLSLALKSRNPLYGLLLRFGMWLDGLPRGLRIGVLILPFVLTRILRPYEGQTWAEVLLVVVVALVLLSWTLEPLMNCVLLLTRERHLLTRPARRATYGFLAFTAVALACAITAMADGPPELLPLAFGLGLWAMVTGSIHNLRPPLQTVITVGAAAAAALGAMAIVAALLGTASANIVAGIILFTGIAATWVTGFSR
ncbi:tetratricopeptide repeat protein [Actinophytocola sp.]|uniref:tetratricopeptide repeat protein n=1 Tax=Actinophytocola sp. TaxID=1872138 RepID=UPI002D80669D|nr:tetratricopeptide repeat protein [Actinophytocola sp.]HET9139426.1 tetratricopeptide repeat protein [Actinophytocola sp.]